MPSASEEVQAAIAAAGGAIRFDEYLRVALYGERGFYTAGGGAGRRGDFITSPEVGPLFGAVLARWIGTQWQLLGEPTNFTVIECGAGVGTLARTVLAAAPRWRGRYVAVEISADQRQRHPEGVRSLAELANGPFTGVIIANELLDNLPFRMAVFDGGWREVGVALGRDASLVETTFAPDPAWHWLPAVAPHGARLPIQEAAAAWVTEAVGRLERGTVLAIDYCTAVTADLAHRKWRDWLRTYRGHERGEHYLRNPGGQDVTSQVCIDQLPPPGTVESQAEFLRRCGIDALVEEGRERWSAAAARADVEALTMRSRVREADALLDATGLGGFTALAWSSRPPIQE